MIIERVYCLRCKQSWPIQQAGWSWGRNGNVRVGKPPCGHPASIYVRRQQVGRATYLVYVLYRARPTPYQVRFMVWGDLVLGPRRQLYGHDGWMAYLHGRCAPLAEAYADALQTIERRQK